MSSNEPFFIVGCDRSGTTLLRLILNHHPRLCIPYESEFITILHDVAVERFGGCDDVREVEVLLQSLFEVERYQKWEIDNARVGSSVRAATRTVAGAIDAVFRCYMERENKQRWGDKTPRYTLRIPTLAKLFPDARVILMVRDPRDLQLSLAKISWHSSSPLFNARKWKKYLVQGCHDLQQYFPRRHLIVVYEQLVHDPELTVRWITDFLEEDYVPEMLCFYEDAERHQPEGVRDHALTLGPVTNNSVGKWKRELSLFDTYVVEKIAGDFLRCAGYEPSKWNSAKTRAWYGLLFWLKDWRSTAPFW